MKDTKAAIRGLIMIFQHQKTERRNRISCLHTTPRSWKGLECRERPNFTNYRRERAASPNGRPVRARFRSLYLQRGAFTIRNTLSLALLLLGRSSMGCISIDHPDQIPFGNSLALDEDVKSSMSTREDIHTC